MPVIRGVNPRAVLADRVHPFGHAEMLAPGSLQESNYLAGLTGATQRRLRQNGLSPELHRQAMTGRLAQGASWGINDLGMDTESDSDDSEHSWTAPATERAPDSFPGKAPRDAVASPTLVADSESDGPPGRVNDSASEQD